MPQIIIPDLAGTTLKKQYYLRERVGIGGMAEVYLAWDTLRATKMAVKILLPDLASDRKFKIAMEKEFELLRTLEHPNIVRVFDFESKGDHVFIVMAWVDGGNLRQRIKALARPLTLAEVGSILQPICSALNFAHNMHAYHCDIKPSNIMLHQNGRDVFLADFGVARLADEKKGGGGTHQYFAPERFSHVVDAKTDIYALGVTVYEMLSGGNLPYHGDSRSPGSTTRDRLAWEHSHLPLPPLREFNDSLPQEILDIVDKALRKEPSQRFDSALSFWKAFERATGSSRVVAPVEDATRFEPQPSGNKNVGEAHSEPIKPSQPPFTPSALGRTYLEGQSGELAGQFIPISSPSMQVGRGTACQIRLLEQSVSRHHATLIVTRRGVYLRDDGSSLGTLLNGVRIPPHVPMPLHSGDVIQIGYFQIFAFRSG